MVKMKTKKIHKHKKKTKTVKMKTNKTYNHLSILLCIFLLILTINFFNVISDNNKNISVTDSNENLLGNLRSSSVEKIEVYHFHSNRQCNVCKTIGAYSEETINRYFSEELASGKIVYEHLNVQAIETKEITMKYGAQGTSVWIGVYDDNGFHAENDVGIWYRLSDKEAFISYLKNLIEKRLEGNLN